MIAATIGIVDTSMQQVDNGRCFVKADGSVIKFFFIDTRTQTIETA